jgi:hypothetical protein
MSKMNRVKQAYMSTTLLSLPTIVLICGPPVMYHQMSRGQKKMLKKRVKIAGVLGYPFMFIAGIGIEVVWLVSYPGRFVWKYREIGKFREKLRNGGANEKSRMVASP